MPRVVTFGRMPDTPPPGTFKRIVFPQLALLDQGTAEGYINRILSSDGGSTRDLPRTISYQDRDFRGHDDALHAGALWEVTIDGEAGIMSGQGWLADNEVGHDTHLAVLSKSLYTNSVDLADIPPDGIKLTEHGDWFDDDWHVDVEFLEWALAKTTLVAVPAFKNAHAVTEEEITASLESDEPLVVEFQVPPTFSGWTATEMVAGMETLPPWDMFHRPESDIPHKIQVSEPDENGWVHVYGHLARWGKPHTGYDGRSTYAPRSRNDYATFCQPSVLTDRGMVRTGPMVLYGGHIDLRAAADDPRNAWADVRVTDGKHGPWLSGVARPHISAEMAERYVARASRISGHWKGQSGREELRMIISCSAEGFPVEYQPGVDEIVASFEVDSGPVVMPSALMSFAELTTEDAAKVKEWVRAAATQGVEVATAAANDDADDTNDESDDDFDAELAALARERALAMEGDTP